MSIHPLTATCGDVIVADAEWPTLEQVPDRVVQDRFATRGVLVLRGFDANVRRQWQPGEAFGPGRAMFESNFPPDKGQCSYQVIFNAFKRIAAPCSEAEKTALFSKTASDIYRLKLG